MALVMEIDERVLSAKFDAIVPHLDERQRRLVLAAEARSLGHGGISLVARASGVSRVTITAGVGELEGGGDAMPGRARRSGAGRKPLTETDPGLLDALDALVEPETRGDPISRGAGPSDRPATSPASWRHRGTMCPATASAGC